MTISRNATFASPHQEVNKDRDVPCINANERAVALTIRSELRISRTGVGGTGRIAIRRYDRSGGQMFPTRDGLSISADALPALIEALKAIGGRR